MREVHRMISVSAKIAIYSETQKPSAAALGFKFLVHKSYCYMEDSGVLSASQFIYRAAARWKRGR
jgi:hypothetical protein